MSYINDLPTPPGGCRIRGRRKQKQTKSQETQKGARNGLQETPDRGEVRRKADVRCRLRCECADSQSLQYDQQEVPVP